MELSHGEKLILVMLCDLYEKLKIDGEIDPQLVSSAIASGNLWALEWQYPSVFHGSEPTQSMIHETLNILDMWSFLERAYNGLSLADKARVEKETTVFRDARFRGWDGNGEARYIGIARFLVDKLHRFQEFKGRELNSHMPCRAAYQRMFEMFEPMPTSLGTSDLDVDQVIRILNEAVSPENRKADHEVRIPGLLEPADTKAQREGPDGHSGDCLVAAERRTGSNSHYAAFIQRRQAACTESRAQKLRQEHT